MGPQLFDLYQATILDIAQSRTAGSLPLPSLERGRVFAGIEEYNPLCTSASDTAIVALLKSLGKKFTDEVTGESMTQADREAAALEKFQEANATCRETNLRLRTYLNSGFSGSSPLDAFLRGCLGEAQRFIHRTLMWTDESGLTTSNVPIRDLLASLRCGPGSAHGVNGETFIHKCIAGPMTMTSEGLYSLYTKAIKVPPKMYGDDGLERSGSEWLTWARSEEERELRFGHQVIRGSKLAFAPKSWKIARTIATEPSLNMMFQLGLHEQLCFFLRRIGFDLPTQQDRNRTLAERGSLTGDWFTMDLSSASDSVSIELVRYLFPEDWFNWFMLTRSPAILINGEWCEQHMMSSMGNGYTFVVETLVFLSLIVGVYTMLNLPIGFPSKKATGNIGVYGDDLIGLREAFGPLSLLLQHVGFSVNPDKSFNDGFFRESCGGDFFLGHNVRGVYATSLSTPQERASLINRLNVWGCEHGVVFRNAARLLQWTDPFVLVPLYEQDDAGTRVPHCLALALFNRRAGRTLCKSLKCDPNTAVYRRWEPILRKEAILDKWGNPVGFIAFSGDGILLAALQGALQGRWMSLRSTKSAYKLTLAAAPGWNCLPAGAFPSKRKEGWLSRYERHLYSTYVGMVG